MIQPHPCSVLSLDIGNKRIGIAGCDPLGISITHLPAIFRNGFEEEESIEQIQLALAQTNNQLKYAKNTLKIQQEMLKFVIGYPIENPLKLSNELDDIFNEDLYFETLPNTDNIDNNIDIRIADNNVKSEALKLKLEQSKALPKVNAFINQTYTGNSNEFTFTIISLHIQRPSSSDTPKKRD